MHILDFLADHYVVAGTGSSTFDEHDITITYQLYEMLADLQQDHNNLLVMSGGARGWDYVIAREAKRLKIPYVLILPNETYIDYYWSRRNKSFANDRLSDAQQMVADAVMVYYVCEDAKGSRNFWGGANLDRNDFMAQHANEFLVYDGASNGTRQCVATIKRMGKKMTDFAAL